MTHPGEESSATAFDGRGHAAPWLDRYRTGELAADEHERVAQHLAGCDACREALARLDAFAATVARGFAAERALRTAAGHAPDWAGQQAAIVARTTGSARAAGGGRALRRGWLPRYAPQAALVLVAVIAIGVVLREGIRGPADVPAPAAVEEAERAVAESDQTSARSTTETATSGTAGGESAARAPAPTADGPTPRADTPAVAPLAAPAPPGAPSGADQRRQRVARENAAPAQDALAADPFDRFRIDARRALAARDTLAATRALAFWRDSLAPRNDLPPARRRSGAALADSLAGLLEAGSP